MHSFIQQKQCFIECTKVLDPVTGAEDTREITQTWSELLAVLYTHPVDLTATLLL